IQTEDVAQAIVRVNERHAEKPLLAVLMGRQGLPAGVAELQGAHIPAFTFPESAARTLGAMWSYGESARRPVGQPVAFDADDDAVHAIIERTVQAGRTRLSEPDALRVLEAYGVTIPPWEFVEEDGSGTLAERTARAAGSIGFPVALKLVSPEVVHKTDVGGVVLGLESAAEVEAAAARLEDADRQSASADRQSQIAPHRSPIAGLLVQRMAPRGTETIVGATRVPRVGSMIMFGMGGVYVEVMRDVVLRLGPLLDADARKMIRGVRLYRLLEGVRGEAPRDVAALEEVILRVSQLTERHPEIAELDVNPLIALEEGAGAIAVDVRVGVG
ncbi:MAG: acetate--CoA ligase family protein, partial [Gemmatimonadales bacterium]